MSHPEIDQAFLSRFQDVCRRGRRMHVGWVLAGLAIAALGTVTLVALLDWKWELARPTRQWLLGLSAAALAGAALWLILRARKQWSAPSTAAELEQHFPSLGQRVRTAVQYGRESEDRLRHEGVAPALVTALSRETAERTRPLGLDDVAPTRRFAVAAALAVAAAAGLGLSTIGHREWRAALSRTLLREVPYTTVAVLPGDVTIEDGGSVDLQLTISGRTGREVVVLSRPVAGTDGDWSEEELDPSAAERDDDGSLRFSTKLARIREPVEYRVVAGPAVSDTYRIGVRYPLTIQSVTAKVTPPAYTGLPPTTVMDGNISALKGSSATVTVALDRVPSSAAIQFRRLGSDTSELPAPPPVKVEGTAVSFDLNLLHSLQWSLTAKSVDDTALPEKLFRVRVREDQAPRVSFISPEEELEVHSLTEVAMALRATDDYGLARSGIIFQINSEDEHTLLEEDFAAATAALGQAAAESGTPSGLTARTRAELERTLPLEYFALTQKDCIAYYAFAEDNYPEAPHRSETDLRFIDIRPFKQIWRIREAMPGENTGDGNDLVALEELIRRQRYALNRTNRLSKFPDRWGDGELRTVDRLMDYESDLAAATRELAQALQFRGIDDADVLFQAEGSMLAAVDSLSVGNNDTAVLQEKDAQQYLVEARDRLEMTLSQDPQARAAIRQANRQLSQKLRRPKTDEEQQRRIVERLVQLAMQQQNVAESVAAMNGEQGGGAMPEESQDEKQPRDPGDTADAEAAEPTSDAGEPAESPEKGAGEPAEDPAENGAIGNGDSAMEESGQPGGASIPSLQDLQDRQADIVAEALELQKILNELPEATELAKQRIATAAQTADASSGALVREEMAAAEEAAEQAADQFSDLARQMSALLAPETAQQVAMARDLAGEIAYRDAELADELDEKQAGDGSQSDPAESQDGGDEPPGTDAQEEAERLAAAGETLQDLMQAVARSGNPDSVEAKDRIAELYETEEIPDVVERMQGLPERLQRPDEVPESVVELRDLGERLEVAAVELDRLYRSIVAPRIEELKQLDERVASLQEELDMLPDESEVSGWHDDLDELLGDLEEQEMGGGAAEEMRKTVESEGPAVAAGGWRIGGDGFYLAPEGYHRNLRKIAEAVQQHIQELLLADLLASEDEATPPGFAPLVDQYLKVLATEAGADAP